MKKRAARFMAPAALAAALAFALACEAVNDDDLSDAERFELMRAHADAWLDDVHLDSPLVCSSFVKISVVELWDTQEDHCQIVSVRSAERYLEEGHGLEHRLRLRVQLLGWGGRLPGRIGSTVSETRPRSCRPGRS